MTNKEIKDRLTESINLLLENDRWLIRYDLSEQSVTHKLAEHLQSKFPDYNVDCEYNRNIEREDGKKRINVIKNELEQFGLLRQNEQQDIEKELTERAVFPDIIVHHRGTNEGNLCIIEVKKSTSSVPSDYDEIKLKAYTSNNYGNDLKYQLGVFIEFSIQHTDINYRICFFKDGKKIKE